MAECVIKAPTMENTQSREALSSSSLATSVGSPRNSLRSHSQSPRSSKKRTFDEMKEESSQQSLDIGEDPVVNELHNLDAGVITLCVDSEQRRETEPNESDIRPSLEEPEPPLKRRKVDMDNLSTLGRLSMNPAYSDIHFLVGGRRFHGIKAIFAEKCPVFREMFYGPTKTYEDTVKIDNITANAFEFIKDHVNELKPQLFAEIVVEVLNASKKYDDNEGNIKKQCYEFLSTIDNADDFLSVLKEFGETRSMIDELGEVLESHFELLQSNGSEIITSEKWKSLPFWLIKKVMQSDNLAVNEEQLFQESLCWINTNKQELKRYIRFSRMETEYIFNEIKNHGILSDADLVSLYEMKLGLADECVFNCTDRFPVKKKRKGRKKKVSPKAKDEDEDEEEWKPKRGKKKTRAKGKPKAKEKATKRRSPRGRRKN